MNDVCPWEDVPGPSNITDQDAVASTSSATNDQINNWSSIQVPHDINSRTSRKNSMQFDSCSSSSDVSLAMAETSDRFKKTIGHQHSMCIPPPSITRNYSVGSNVRVKLSDTTRPSVYTCSYTSPQHSFDHSVLQVMPFFLFININLFISSS